MAHIYTMTAPASIHKSQSPKHKPLFKSKPEVITDPIFKERLASKLVEWEQVREAGANTDMKIVAGTTGVPEEPTGQE